MGRYTEIVVQPDVLFVAKAHSAIIDQKGGVHGAPDLAVEILSPSTAARDQILKRTLYGRYGVQEYWIVDPEAQSVEVLSMTGSGLDTWRRFTGDETLGSLLLPGLSIGLGDIFKA